MLYADDACIVSRSPQGLERMMAIFVDVFGAFGLTVSDPTCTGEADNLQRNGAAVPPDHLVHLPGGLDL